jgi:GNAT superfamily N-acetyltransferase
MNKSFVTPTAGFTVRFAEISDVPLIFHFIKSLAVYEKMLDRVIATEEGLKETLFVHPCAEVLIAEEQNKPIGFALFYTTYSTFQGQANLFLEDLFIEPDFRGKGYGKLLFSCLATIAKERGYRRMDWWCLQWNLPSIGFYEKMGAKQLDEWSIFRLQDEKITELAQNLHPEK